MKNKITISYVGEIYQLAISINIDGAYTLEEETLNLENTTLEKAIKNALGYHICATGASLFKRDVFEDDAGNKYFSESKFVKEIEF